LDNLPAANTLHELFVTGGVDKLAEVLLKLPQPECPVYHRFGPNLYIREMMAPAGILLIGHYQKLEHLNVFIKGKVQMFNEDGTTTILTAPMMFVSPPGQKVGIILEDMVWENIYSTPERDLEKLEEMIVDKSVRWELSESQRLNIEREKHKEDREDYQKMLADSGLTHEIARKDTEQQWDREDIELTCTQLGNSPIDGKGLFATANIKKGDFIVRARINGKRTQGGRYANHSANPNAEMFKHDNGDLSLKAIKDIVGNRAGQLGDEITVDYRQCLRVNDTYNR
jgi:hypothetical protein